MSALPDAAADPVAPDPRDVAADAPDSARRVWRRLWRHLGVRIGAGLLLLIVLIGGFAPLLASSDPTAINPSARNQVPGATFTERNDEGQKVTRTSLMGTDTLGRDIYSRVVYGARVSLVIGVAVAAVSVAVGLFIGLLAGYFRGFDAVVMRIMDGLMAIPAILLAIALVSLAGATLATVIVAIAIPEIPRVVRLVRSIVLSIREEPYVEAAVSVGTPTPRILWRHILPNTIAPLIVQATFIAGSAILLEAILSFLGVGISPETPTWGNIMAEARQVFQLYPHGILFPGILLAVTVLSINMLGDGLRDAIDPRLSRQIR
jgi:peptide/nickel transport system permease protein